MSNKVTSNHQIQLDIPDEQIKLMDMLASRLKLRSHAAVWQTAYEVFLWVVNETQSGHHVVSMDTEALAHSPRYRELNVSLLHCNLSPSKAINTLCLVHILGASNCT